ncbi:type-F conjugative transfer system protein TrbI [Budviciaceae bacterium BWR-B9]|uniref:Type-F conjugative transfer system protein TrbI n=1 Tax=Limnobaculum allomyrinae TaxID=2791986 RepID=A0ABS1IUW1_9GAMM|nr:MULTISPECIES: type-F conjugative transfer system protein TrbI [Limnobaculum]MBK5145544.1 type-F conjugative transfer system protein TrbI [Limnobaculum allomyrinae]MBV7693663.1 type-F conjugative transfer system protein TrbI [Limnobaculum sp. M2-1]
MKTSKEKTIKRSPRRQRCLKASLAAIVFICLLNAGITLLLVLWLAPAHKSIVTFDMKSTVDQFMEQAASRSLSEEQSAVLSAKFTDALNTSLIQYQEENRALILVKPAVVFGAKDITADIQHDVSEWMRKE